MLYGGKNGITPKYSIPTYISQSENTVVEEYKKINQATSEIKNDNLITYINPNNSYEIVVNQTVSESLMEAFQKMPELEILEAHSIQWHHQWKEIFNMLILLLLNH